MTTETDDTPYIHADALKAIQRAAQGRWSDAETLLGRLAYESARQWSWRPARAGMLVGIQEGPAVWMTVAEFEAWRARFKLRGAKLFEVTSIGRHRLASIRERGEPISRVEALACAHYALGLDQPVASGDVEAFAAWAAPRFGAFEALGAWLQVRGDWITDRMRGYDLRGGKRIERTPEGSLIRAMDYVWRVGPSCPYGDRPAARYWPNQDEGLS